MAVSIIDKPPTPAGISILDSSFTQSLPQDIIEERAKNYDFAMGDETQGIDFYRDSLTLQRDVPLRQENSLQEQIKLRQERITLVEEYMKQREPTKPLDAEEADFLNNLTDEDVIQARTDPSTFFERKFAETATKQLKLEDLRKENPSAADEVGGAVDDVLAHQQAVRKAAMDFRARLEGESTGTQVLSTIKEFLPFYLRTDPSDALEGIGEAFLPGNSNIEKADWYYQTSLSQAMPIVLAEAEKLYQDNPAVAVAFLENLAGYSASDQFLDNAIGVGDVSLAVPGGGVIPFAVATRGASAARVAANAAGKELVRSTARRTINNAAMNAATGNVERTALEEAVSYMMTRARATGQEQEMDNLLNKAQVIRNPGAVFSQQANLGVEATIRLQREMEKNAARLITTFEDPFTIQRLGASSQALQAGLDAARTQVVKEYPGLVDHMMDVAPVTSPETASGVEAIAFRIGNREALPFKTQGAATNTARNILGLKNFVIEQTGDRQYVITHVKTINETLPEVRNLLVPTDNPTPTTLKNMFIGWLRTGDDVLPKDITDAMKVATYGSSGLLKLVQDVAEGIGSLNGRQKQQLKEFLDYQRDYIDDRGVRGWNSETLAQLETEWYQRFNAMPSEAEARAYFNFRQLHDFDYLVRNIGIHRDRVRLGIEEHLATFRAFVPKISGRGKIQKVIETPPIQGISRKEIDWNVDEDTGIAILDQETGQLETFRKSFISNEDRGRVDNLVKKEGYNLIEMTQWGWKALKETPGISGVPETRVSYLLVKDVQTKPLRFEQIPYRMGPHVENTPGYYLRQANVETTTRRGVASTIYFGDTNIHHFDTESKAIFWQKIMEEGRALFLAGDREVLKNFVESKTPYTFADFMRMWKTESNPNGLLNPNTEVMISQSDVSLASAHNLKQKYPNFFEAKDSAYNIERGVNLEYAGARDMPITTIATEGTSVQPIYRLTPADTIDPLALINRNTNHLLNSRLIDDLKVKASERYVAEFADVIDAPLDELRANPIQALTNDNFLKTAPKEKLAAAKNYRRSVLGFLGMKNDFQKNMDTLKQKLADKIYQRLGQKAFNMVAPHLLHTVKDPARRLRQFAFTAKLGLFNPVQLFLQAQTMAHVTALEGFEVTGRAMAASTLFSYLKYGTDDAAIKYAAKVATKLGWNADEFIESFEAYRKSGMYVVGPEHAFQDALLDPTVFKGRIGRFFDKSNFFFNTGERGVRNVAWNAAYLRWRRANPGKVFDNAAKTQVLSRADLLTVNMSRASSAAWQRGFLSVPTQFFGYQTRLMEQFLGGRLTRSEKLRALLVYSAMYGVPVGAGAAIGGVWNPGEDIRRYFQSIGFDVDESMFKGFMDGAISLGLEWATGTKYNFGSRYGPGGLPWLREMWEGDKDYLELIFGVSGSIAGDMVFDPLMQILNSVWTGRLGDTYPITYDDFVRAGRVVSSVNSAYNFGTAITAGRFFNKHGEPTGEVSTFDGFMSLLGLSPQSFENMYREGSMSRAKSKRLAAIRKLAIEKIRAAWTSEDADSFDDYNKQAGVFIEDFLANGGTPDQVSGVFSEAFRGYETKIESTYRRLLETDPKRYDFFMKQMQKRNKELGRPN